MASSQVSPSFHWHFTELDDRIFQIRGRTLFFVVVLFAIILLLTFLFLYVRWICRYHRLTSAASSASLVPNGRPARQPQGLEPSVINCLPITLHKLTPDDLNSSAECCICLGIFEEGEKVKVLPRCRHCYHSECVDQWLRHQSSCPLCRVSLRVDPPTVQLQQIVTE